MFILLSFIRTIQYILVLITCICLGLIIPNKYTYLQIASIVIYLCISICVKSEKYIAYSVSMLIHIIISVLFIVDMGLNNGVIITILVSWMVIITLFLLDFLYSYYQNSFTQNSFTQNRSEQNNLGQNHSIQNLNISPESLSVVHIISFEQSSEECTICLYPISPHRYITRCKHTFCKTCLDRWISEKITQLDDLTCLTCPTCRQDLCK